MFRIHSPAVNRLDIDISGKLDSTDMRLLIEDLDTQSKALTSGKMLVRIQDFNMPTLGAMGVEISRMPTLFKMIRRFDRAAVVSDKDWIRRMSAVEGAIIPGLEVRGFELHEVAQAEIWLMR